jgi:MYXO-CTERM domain-containing protein
MIRFSHVGRLLVVASVVVLGAAGNARAQEECPLGSTQKSESGQTWCEPTVCDETAPCPAGLVCRPVSLCIEIGTLEQAPGVKTDAGQRLLARQRCGADKSCPQKTTCSDKGRCITQAQAERAGLLSASPAAADAGAAAPGASAPKKGCGCHVRGTSGGLGGAALAMLGMVAIAARRRTRAR